MIFGKVLFEVEPGSSTHIVKIFNRLYDQQCDIWPRTGSSTEPRHEYMTCDTLILVVARLSVTKVVSTRTPESSCAAPQRRPCLRLELVRARSTFNLELINRSPNPSTGPSTRPLPRTSTTRTTQSSTSIVTSAHTAFLSPLKRCGLTPNRQREAKRPHSPSHCWATTGDLQPAGPAHPPTLLRRRSTQIATSRRCRYQSLQLLLSSRHHNSTN